jgi:hypothetical protein
MIHVVVRADDIEQQSGVLRLEKADDRIARQLRCADS